MPVLYKCFTSSPRPAPQAAEADATSNVCRGSLSLPAPKKKGILDITPERLAGKKCVVI